MTTSNLKFPALFAISLVAMVVLSACQRNDDQTVGQKLDEAISQTEQKAEATSDAVKREMAEVKTEAAEAAATVSEKAADAAITASVNAALAKDEQLSALKIDVDTRGGAVSLRGTAPSAQARDRASELTLAVKGVTRVDNQLDVRS